MRAIAVVAVIIYHLKISLGETTVLTGGFLGVDLFFVLSGFLISGILLDEFQKTGRISIGQFYWRRAKRILPPLMLVILASLPAAWFILLPSETDRFAWSIAAALGFVSNIFWYFELSEYGAQSGLLQPFLHTWSLAIEEQFYLVFPPLLIVLMRWGGARRTFIALAGLTVLGLVAAIALTDLHPALSFYSPTSRAWEMLAGVLLAFVARRSPGFGRGGLLTRLAPPLALVVLLASFWMADLVDIAHPGIATIPVVAATCVLIWFADPREAVTRFLSTGPMVWIGRLSYSLYLWHFPVFAFGRLTISGAPGPADMVLWVAITVMLSWVGYRVVETPFRFRVPPRPFAAVTAASMVPVVVFCAVAIMGIRGDGARVEALAELYGENEIDNSVLARQSWSLLDARAPDEDIGPWNALRPSETEIGELWFEREESLKILLVGDSLSKDLWNALVLNHDAFPDVEFARFNLHPRTLSENLQTLVATPNFAAANVVMIAPNYYRQYRETLDTKLTALDGHDKVVVVVGATAAFEAGGAQPLFDWYLRKTGDPEALAELNAIASDFERPRSRARDADIRQIAESEGVIYLPRRDLVCPDDRCTLVTDDGRKTMYDGIHWTLEGAALFGRRAAETGWLDPVRVAAGAGG